MKLKIDLSKEYGLVLEGGGAKGSYQIGAWKALREHGIKIRGIAGASVGALNGALICMDDLVHAEYIWETITYSKVMDIDDNLIEDAKSRDILNINIKELVEGISRIIKDRGVDITPLRTMISEAVDEDKVRASDRELYVTTFSREDKKELVIDLKTVPQGQIPDMLLASAYLIGFKREKLDGKIFYDGGALNNVPVDVLIEHGYQDIIIMRIYGIGFDTERITRIPEGTNVYHIAPRQDLGGILEFDQKNAIRNMTLGYYDAMRFLYGLDGRTYYLDAEGEEDTYFDLLMHHFELTEGLLPETFAEKSDIMGYRFYTEKAFPKLAKKLELKDDWNYKQLYLSLLEEWAKLVKINRFEIYTPQALLEKIHENTGCK